MSLQKAIELYPEVYAQIFQLGVDAAKKSIANIAKEETK